MYNELIKQLDALLVGESDFFANASNFCALIYNNLENLNWVGFYMTTEENLLLGPFQGKPACIRIPFGKGVCGTCAIKKETIIVDNVHEFPGHIACDAASNSEIVIPIIIEDKVFGVLDLDSPIYSRFGTEDSYNLKLMLNNLINSSEMQKVWNYYGSGK